jgi:hypothetical protein
MPSVGPKTDPLGDLSARPGTRPSKTDCQKQGKKDDKKKKKPKHQRSVCHRGTYIEKASGLLKFKKEIIPCQ